MPGRMEIRLDWGRASDGDDDAHPGVSFAILALAPWRGSAPAPGALDARRAVRLDVAAFDEGFARFAPRVVVAGYGEGGSDHPLLPKSLDDLHPDALLREIPALRSLASLLSAARDPATFRDASPSRPTPPPPAVEEDAATLQRLLGRGPSPGATAAGAAESALDRLMREAVKPYIVAGPDPRQAEVVAGLEAAVGAALRVALRQPAFQELEARWRALRRLVFRIETGGPVGVYALDVSRDEWEGDLAAGGDGPPPALRRAIEAAAAKEGIPGFALIVLDATFGARVEDVAALRGWGALAAAAGAPLIAHADASLAGAASGSDPVPAWSELRRDPRAARLGLALPRVLARAPYGPLSDPIETLPFEEAGDDPADEGFVWTGAAWSCAELVAAAAPAGVVEDLPFAIYTAGGGRKIRPCAETLIPDRAAEALLDAGLVPLIADTARSAVRVPRLQSISDPPRALIRA